MSREQDSETRWLVPVLLMRTRLQMRQMPVESYGCYARVGEAAAASSSSMVWSAE
jgi:hypothetical protein